jgi:hypothetical protein
MRILAIILDSSLASFINLSSLFLLIPSIVSLIRQSQYFVSFFSGILRDSAHAIQTHP